MSENSSDSDSSCGWTVISHEGSDIEAAAAQHEGPGSPLELELEDASSLLQEQPVDLQADFGQADASSVGDQGCSASETVQGVPEEEKEKPPEESSCVGAVSDDSDIVTLDTPKVEDSGSPEELAPAEEEAEEEETHVSEDFNMGSSSSSQYTFCPPETVFPAQPRGEESSSDESSCRHTSPALRRRRPKKRAASSSESEEAPPHEQDVGQGKDPSCKHPLGGGLNRCIILALVIAISMGFGHFYGTVQIQKRQQWVEKIQEDEQKEMKGHRVQCQQEHGGGGKAEECTSLKEGLAWCLLTTEEEKKSFESQKDQLASENLRLRASLEEEEKALALLQEELRKLESPERAGVATGSQKLKARLEEGKQERQSFAQQEEALLAEAQMLRRELDKERQLTGALREELDKLSAQQQQQETTTTTTEEEEGFLEDPETKALRGRLAELEKKLSFEQQRSDLWEKLYVEAKDQAEDEKEKKNARPEKGQRRKEEEEKPSAGGRRGSGRGQTRRKATFLGSMKETFDAMKNSTKEFVRHHKEKIKQAKEAVKENLRKFSDSVKSTFSHFKDTTKNIFQEKSGKERQGSDRRREAKRREGPAAGPAAHRAPGGSPKGFGHPRPGARASPPPECPRGAPRRGGNPHRQAGLKGCAGIFDCAHQEFARLFDRVLDPIRADEFNQLVHKYLQQEVGDFHHWRELEAFVGRFFRNGVFIHDQMLFTDFVHDVQDYLADMKEYQHRRRHGRGGGGAFEGLDDYIYHYFFHYDPSPQHGGPSSSHPADKALWRPSQQTQPDRLTPKPQPRAKREGRWQHEGRSGGRQMARLEIEVGQMPFDPKY